MTDQELDRFTNRLGWALTVGVIAAFPLLVLAVEHGFVGWLFGLAWRFIQWNPTMAGFVFLWLFFMLHPAMRPAHVAWHRTLFPEPIKRKGTGGR